MSSFKKTILCIAIASAFTPSFAITVNLEAAPQAEIEEAASEKISDSTTKKQNEKIPFTGLSEGPSWQLIGLGGGALALVGLAAGGGGSSKGSTTTVAPIQQPQPTLSAEYQRNPGLLATNFQLAHEAGYKGAGVIVAVLDTGVSANSEFDSRLLEGLDVNAQSYAGVGMFDANGHGSHVAGIIGAGLNGVGMVGVAPLATILPIKISAIDGTTKSSDVRNLVRDSMAQGAKIYNYSFGTDRSDPFTIEAVKIIKDNGRLLIASAGNQSSTQPLFPAALAPDYAGHVIAVGSLGEDGKLASYSNRAGDAQMYFLVAPGNSVISTQTEGQYATNSGTSMAAPIVSGAAAVVWGKWPWLTAPAVTASLLDSAKDLGYPGVDSIYGRGLLDIQAALNPIGALQTVSMTGTSLPQASIQTTPSVLMAATKSAVQVTAYDRLGRSFSVPLSQMLTADKKEKSVKKSNVMQGKEDLNLQTAKLADSSRFSLGMGEKDPSSYRMSLNSHDSLSHISFWSGRPLSESSVIAGENGVLQNGFVSSSLANPLDTSAIKSRGQMVTLPFAGFVFGAGRAKLKNEDEALEGDESQFFVSTKLKGFSLHSQISFVSTRTIAGYANQGNTEGTRSLARMSFALSPKTDIAWFVVNQTQYIQDSIARSSSQERSVGLDFSSNSVLSENDQLHFSIGTPIRKKTTHWTAMLPTGVDNATGAPVFSEVNLTGKQASRDFVAEVNWTKRFKLGSLSISGREKTVDGISSWGASFKLEKKFN